MFSHLRTLSIGYSRLRTLEQNNGFRTNRNTKPANLDLFMKLDAAITIEEEKNINVGFWHVHRVYNTIADKLAKEAAELGDAE